MKYTLHITNRAAASMPSCFGNKRKYIGQKSPSQILEKAGRVMEKLCQRLPDFQSCRRKFIKNGPCRLASQGVSLEGASRL